jgi:hypothetical protein
MKTRRWQNIGLGLAIALPILGVYIGKKVLAKRSKNGSGLLPEITKIRVPLSSLLGINDPDMKPASLQERIILPDNDKSTEFMKTEFMKEEETKVVTFVASTDRDKYHKPDCRWAQNIIPDNLVTFSSKDTAISQGYSACASCNP